MEAIDRAAKARQRTKAADVQALSDLRQVVVREVTQNGMAETEAARRGGVDRMTVRKWLGKR